MPVHATREKTSLGTALADFPPSRSFASAASLTIHSRANANEHSSATHLWLRCGPHWEPTLVWISTGEMNKGLVMPGMAPETDRRTDCTQIYIGESMSWVRAVYRSMNEGLMYQHGHLRSAYIGEENFSLSTTINFLYILKRGQDLLNPLLLIVNCLYIVGGHLWASTLAIVSSLYLLKEKRSLVSPSLLTTVNCLYIFWEGQGLVSLLPLNC